MKISRKPTLQVLYEAVEAGQVFEWEGEYYIKAVASEGYKNPYDNCYIPKGTDVAVDLVTGELCYDISTHDEVRLCEYAKISLD